MLLNRSQRLLSHISHPCAIARLSQPPTVGNARRFHNHLPNSASKDSQHKDDLKPRSTEYSKSGSDDDSAKATKAAFDPGQTSPEEELNAADESSGAGGKSNGVSPLDVSPANRDVSQPRGATEGGAEGSKSEAGGATRDRTSGRGSPRKAGKGNA